jgi:restriction system protein
MFGGAAKHERRTAEARAQFESVMSGYRQREAERQRALAAAKAEYERMAADVHAKAAAQNAAIDARKAAFETGDTEAVEWFVGQVLDASRYPDGFPRRHQVAYRPENQDVVVEFELPPQQVVPTVRGYRYVKMRDAIDPLPRQRTRSSSAMRG